MAVKHDIADDRKDRFIASPIGMTIRMPDGQTFEVVQDSNGNVKKVDKKQE